MNVEEEPDEPLCRREAFLDSGSMTFLIVGFAVGVVLLNSRLPMRWGRIWLTALLGLYWLLSLPVTAHTLIQNLQYPQHDPT